MIKGITATFKKKNQVLCTNKYAQNLFAIGVPPLEITSACQSISDDSKCSILEESGINLLGWHPTLQCYELSFIVISSIIIFCVFVSSFVFLALCIFVSLCDIFLCGLLRLGLYLWSVAARELFICGGLTFFWGLRKNFYLTMYNS